MSIVSAIALALCSIFVSWFFLFLSFFPYMITLLFSQLPSQFFSLSVRSLQTFSSQTIE